MDYYSANYQPGGYNNNNNGYYNNSRNTTGNYMSDQYKPIRPIGYVGYMWLFAIPIVGFICLIVFALSDENINRRNFARSYFWNFLICFIFCIIFYAILFVGIGGAIYSSSNQTARDASSSIDSLSSMMSESYSYGE